MRGGSAGVLAVAVLALAGCGSTSKSGSSSTAASAQAKATPQADPQTGCRSQLTVDEHITLRVQLTAPKSAKYTLVRLEGASGLTVNSVTDETKARGRSNGINGEYVLPGPRSGATKTVAATITATKVVGVDTVNLRAWGSDQTSSAPPSNAPSTACPVTVISR